MNILLGNIVICKVVCKGVIRISNQQGNSFQTLIEQNWLSVNQILSTFNILDRAPMNCARISRLEFYELV